MKAAQKAAKKRVPAKRANIGRGEKTRRMILDAAIKVFAAHPYNAASIRMIAARGGFYHGLIRYHFPSKAIIFETVVEEVHQHFLKANKEWLSEISTRSPQKALALYLDRIIEFYQTQPDVFRIIVQNISHDDPSHLPGYQHMVNSAISSRKGFVNTFPLLPKDKLHTFLTAFNMLSLNFLGADTFYAATLGMAPKSDEYLQWVKETMISIFLPFVKNTFSSIS